MSRKQKTHIEHGDKGFIEDQRRFFDQLVTEDWDAYRDPVWDRSRRYEVDAIMEIVGQPATVLDVGCGCGFHDIEFAKMPHVKNVVGIDPSPLSIEQANKHYPSHKVSRYAGDFFNTNQTFDSTMQRFELVCSFQVIEHVKDPKWFLKKCSDYCIDGGFISVVTPNQKSLQNRMRAMVGKSPVVIDPLHFKEYTVSDLMNIGKELELQIAGVFGHTWSLSINRFKVIPSSFSFIFQLSKYIPSLSCFIGVVFQKKA